MSATTQASRAQGKQPVDQLRVRVDPMLLLSVVVLAGLGLVMVASASISIADRATGEPLYYFNRQLVFVAFGVMGGVLTYHIRLHLWERASMSLLIIAVVLLMLVLIPGLGKSVNGSSRWLSLGVFNLQVSEPAKLFTIIYLAGYLVRRGHEVRETMRGFIKPVIGLSVISVLLLLEPDYGAVVVLMTTALGMLFLGGVRLWQFVSVMLAVSAVMALLAVSSSYRLERIMAFMNPWADPYNSGFQLTQSLIAIGSGSWFGQGLGGSIQKLFYLPEAHTDFLFAVLAEELGLVGVITVIGLFTLLVWRCFAIGKKAAQVEMRFAAFLAHGIGVWLGLQAFINMGVNMGMLPTKGLTLPLMSSGGSSMLVVCVAIGLLLRIHRETQFASGSSVAGAKVPRTVTP